MNNYYTYAYLREDGTPYYIGKGKNNRAYHSTHVINLPKDKDRILFLKQNLTEEEAFKHEKYMIHVLGRKDLGTGILRNFTDGGEGISGYIHSEETKEKIGNSNRGENSCWYGKKFSEVHKRKLSEARKGKPRSEGTRRKIGEFNRGKIISEEHRKKISEVHKGKVISEETKKKISESKRGENHHMFGKSHSEETKKKMSEIHKGKIWINDGIKNYFIKLNNQEIPIGFVLGMIKKNKINRA